MNSRLLPKLELSSRTSSHSPFQYPSDEEIFLFNENRLRKQFSLHKPTSKVWNKETTPGRTKLTRFEVQSCLCQKVPTPYDESYVKNHKLFKEKDQKTIDSALKIISERKISKDEQKEEVQLSNVKIIEEKRQTFLVSQAYNVIENEIGKLKKTSSEKQGALNQSYKMLEQDSENFQKYLDQNKQARADAEIKLDNEIKERKGKEAIIKQLIIKMTSIRGEKTRMEELISAFMDHKQFLDKLAPKDWLDTRSRLKGELINNVRDEIVQSRNESSRTALEAQKFAEELEDFEDEYEMYFKQPQQLIQVFNDLEERNLFLIQTAQDTEQNLEELKGKFEQLKIQKEIKIQQLHEHKESLKKKLDLVTQEIKELQSNGIVKTQGKEQKDLGQQVIDVYQQFQSDMISVQDIQNRSTLFILGLIEQLIEKLLKTVKTFKPDRVFHYKQEIDNKGKADKRKENADRQREEEAARNRINQLKLMQPSKKKIGRLNMFRSRPSEKQRTVSEENIEDVDNEDFKYFE